MRRLWKLEMGSLPSAELVRECYEVLFLRSMMSPEFSQLRFAVFESAPTGFRKFGDEGSVVPFSNWCFVRECCFLFFGKGYWFITAAVKFFAALRSQDAWRDLWFFPHLFERSGHSVARPELICEHMLMRTELALSKQKLMLAPCSDICHSIKFRRSNLGNLAFEGVAVDDGPKLASPPFAPPREALGVVPLDDALSLINCLPNPGADIVIHDLSIPPSDGKALEMEPTSAIDPDLTPSPISPYLASTAFWKRLQHLVCEDQSGFSCWGSGSVWVWLLCDELWLDAIAKGSSLLNSLAGYDPVMINSGCISCVEAVFPVLLLLYLGVRVYSDPDLFCLGLALDIPGVSFFCLEQFSTFAFSERLELKDADCRCRVRTPLELGGDPLAGCCEFLGSDGSSCLKDSPYHSIVAVASPTPSKQNADVESVAASLTSVNDLAGHQEVAYVRPLGGTSPSRSKAVDVTAEAAARIVAITLFTSCWQVTRWYDLNLLCLWSWICTCWLHLSCHMLKTIAGWYMLPVGVKVLLSYLLRKLPLTEVNEPLSKAAAGNVETGFWSLVDAGEQQFLICSCSSLNIALGLFAFAEYGMAGVYHCIDTTPTISSKAMQDQSNLDTGTDVHYSDGGIGNVLGSKQEPSRFSKSRQTSRPEWDDGRLRDENTNLKFKLLIGGSPSFLLHSFRLISSVSLCLVVLLFLRRLMLSGTVSQIAHHAVMFWKCRRLVMLEGIGFAFCIVDPFYVDPVSLDETSWSFVNASADFSLPSEVGFILCCSWSDYLG
ncbi:hypothetical protein Nepgr_007874 [Nepenthes gracilis]|uniref:Uncharacterized protein n=1 Tax=Nepenthes gracilis TaxID=150966 RepID=A0AAD3S7X5_NEPGR|nr:hypothetical protein Nepgr_007874 [Nepenthes gracilis]